MGVLSWCWRGSRRQALTNPSKRTRVVLRRRKHGTTDRLALPHQNRPKGEFAETVRSAPGRGSTDGAVYTDFDRDGKGKGDGIRPLGSRGGNRTGAPRLDILGPP